MESNKKITQTHLTLWIHPHSVTVEAACAVRRSPQVCVRMAVAEADGQVVGFAHAVVKLAPEHLGGSRIGHIAHVFVAPTHRRSGLARELVRSLHDWLHAKQVTSIELQVVHRNEVGLAFWRSLGYLPELIQLRKS